MKSSFALFYFCAYLDGVTPFGVSTFQPPNFRDPSSSYPASRCCHVAPVTVSSLSNERGSKLTTRSATFEKPLTASNEERLGLLRGVDPQTDDFYSSEIDMSVEGLAWLSKPGIFWAAVKKDAAEMNITAEEYLKKVLWNFERFFVSGAVHDHEGLTKKLDQHCLALTGQLVLVLGGLSVGKSLVLSNLRDRYNRGDAKDKRRLVLYVDGREHSHELASGLIQGAHELIKDETSKVQLSSVSFGQVTSSTKAKAAAAAGLLQSKKFVTMNEKHKQLSFTSKFMDSFNLVGRNLASQNTIQSYVEYAEERGYYPVIIIDEANKVIGSKEADTKEVLMQIVQSTKRRQMNVVLCSSDHGYLQQLNREGLKSEYVSSILVAGDISPQRTWDLYVNGAGTSHTFVPSERTSFEGTVNEDHRGTKGALGMGPHLAELCLATFGGHLWHTRNAILSLSFEKEFFMAVNNLPPLAVEVDECLKVRGTRPLLEVMAKYGFAPVDNYEDKAVEAVVKHEIGGILTRHTRMMEHIPQEVWANYIYTDYGLIPSYHAVRLSLARQLALKPKSFWSKTWRFLARRVKWKRSL